MSTLALLFVMGQLNVGFALSHGIGPKLPKLVVTMKNEGAAPVPLMRFGDDVCFAAYQLSVRVEAESQGKELDELPDCPVLSFPGLAGALAPGAVEKRELDLGRLFPALKPSKGYYQVFAQWAPYALKGFGDGGFVTKNANPVSSALKLVIASPLGKVRAVAKKPVTLSDGSRFTLLRHGHKDTMPDGPPSPLIIHGRFAAPGKTEAEVDAHIYLDESRVFVLGGGFVFELGAYGYDEFMELTAYGWVPPPRE